MADEFMEFTTFTTTDKDGNTIEMAVVDEFEYEHKNYVVASIIENDTINEDGMFIFMGKVIDGELSVEKIADEKEYEKIANAYLDMEDEKGML